MKEHLHRFNPHFVEWLRAQSESVQDAVAQQWNLLGDASDIAHGMASGQHAKRARLIQWCAENHGLIRTGWKPAPDRRRKNVASATRGGS